MLCSKKRQDVQTIKLAIKCLLRHKNENMLMKFLQDKKGYLSLHISDKNFPLAALFYS